VLGDDTPFKLFESSEGVDATGVGLLQAHKGDLSYVLQSLVYGLAVRMTALELWAARDVIPVLVYFDDYGQVQFSDFRRYQSDISLSPLKTLFPKGSCS